MEAAPSSSLAGYDFADPALLREALTHPVAGRRGPTGEPFDFQRLEFLGDAVIGLALAAALHAARPDAREGELSARRASLVSRSGLARVSRRLGIPALIDAGNDGRVAARVRSEDSAAADAFEAVTGAVYSDSGYESARAFVLSVFGGDIAAAAPVDSPKNRLQEALQARVRGSNAEALLDYRTVSAEGPPHARLFAVEVWFDGAPRGRGEGLSLKIAGEEAAREALRGLGDSSGF